MLNFLVSQKWTSPIPFESTFISPATTVASSTTTITPIARNAASITKTYLSTTVSPISFESTATASIKNRISTFRTNDSKTTVTNIKNDKEQPVATTRNIISKSKPTRRSATTSFSTIKFKNGTRKSVFLQSDKITNTPRLSTLTSTKNIFTDFRNTSKSIIGTSKTVTNIVNFKKSTLTAITTAMKNASTSFYAMVNTANNTNNTINVTTSPLSTSTNTKLTTSAVYPTTIFVKISRYVTTWMRQSKQHASFRSVTRSLLNNVTVATTSTSTIDSFKMSKNVQYGASTTSPHSTNFTNAGVWMQLSLRHDFLHDLKNKSTIIYKLWNRKICNLILKFAEETQLPISFSKNITFTAGTIRTFVYLSSSSSSLLYRARKLLPKWLMSNQTSVTVIENSVRFTNMSPDTSLSSEVPKANVHRNVTNLEVYISWRDYKRVWNNQMNNFISPSLKSTIKISVRVLCFRT